MKLNEHKWVPAESVKEFFILPAECGIHCCHEAHIWKSKGLWSWKRIVPRSKRKRAVPASNGFAVTREDAMVLLAGHAAVDEGFGSAPVF